MPDARDSADLAPVSLGLQSLNAPKIIAGSMRTVFCVVVDYLTPGCRGERVQSPTPISPCAVCRRRANNKPRFARPRSPVLGLLRYRFVVFSPDVRNPKVGVCVKLAFRHLCSSIVRRSIVFLPMQRSPPILQQEPDGFDRHQMRTWRLSAEEPNCLDAFWWRDGGRRRGILAFSIAVIECDRIASLVAAD